MKHIDTSTGLLTAQSVVEAISSGNSANPERLRDEWLEKLSSRNDVRISQSLMIGCLRGADAALIFLLGAIVGSAYLGALNIDSYRHYWTVMAIAAIAGPIALQMTGVYQTKVLASAITQVVRIFAVVSSLFMCAIAGIFLLKLSEEFSRVWLVTWTTASAVAISSLHLGARYLMSRWHKQGRLSTRVVIVGGGEPASKLVESVQQSPAGLIEFVGLFDDRNDARSPHVVANLPKLGSIAELAAFARKYSVDMLVVTLPLTAENRLLQVMKQLWVLPVDIRLSAHSQALRYRPRAYSWLGNVPLIDVFDRPLRDWSLLVKTLEDKLLASLAIVVLSPVMLVVALAIKLESKGPVIFRQVRYGFNNKPVNVFKFRSMYTDMCDANASRLVTREDPRVTRVGKFIRRTSLDELPQFFNVLRGDLSLVGPRPHAQQAKAADQLYDQVVDGYFARHRVKPGITGWAQINGWRGETDTEEKIQRRVEFDLYYIENWSLLFDLQILAATPFALMKSENAY